MLAVRIHQLCQQCEQLAPTRASRPLPGEAAPAYATSAPPEAATSVSRTPYSSPRTPLRSATPKATPTINANATKANTTTQPPSASQPEPPAATNRAKHALKRHTTKPIRLNKPIGTPHAVFGSCACRIPPCPPCHHQLASCASSFAPHRRSRPAPRRSGDWSPHRTHTAPPPCAASPRPPTRAAVCASRLQLADPTRQHLVTETSQRADRALCIPAVGGIMVDGHPLALRRVAFPTPVAT